MAITEDLQAYKAQVNNDVSTQSDPDSIAPDVVGSIGTDLADIILPELLKINKFEATGGTVVPSGGLPDDIYYKSNLNEIQIWRNVNGAWQNKGTIPLGISYPDGIIIGLRTSIAAYIVTVSPGTWVIANTTYSKGVQTQFTIAPKDINYGRWDLIYANSASQVLLIKGVASSVPAKPLLPANSILVDYVYIPSTGAPFLFSGSVNNAGTSAAVKTLLKVEDGSFIINWQTDIVPNDVVTYAQKHGNSIGNIQGFNIMGVDDDGDPQFSAYSPEVLYTRNPNGEIKVLTLLNVFAGDLTIS